MGIMDNGFKVGTGLAIGLGALILAPAVIPVVGSVIKPLLKASIKSGLILVERTRELVAETREVMEDMAAEAQSELIRERRAASAPVEGQDIGHAT